MRTRIAAAVGAAALVVPVVGPDVFASVAPAVRFSRVQYNSPGTDTGSNKSLNAEWVRVTNHAGRAKTLTGWTVRDRDAHVYRFPKFTLRAGASVRVHTGKGKNSRVDLYWRRDWYVWDNTGDRAVLKSRSGSRVDSCSWGAGPGSTAC